MDYKKLAEQAGCNKIDLYDIDRFIDLELFAELILEQERKEAAEHYLKLIRDCVLTEREACAKLVEEVGRQTAAAIRARGDKND